jgi:hypothetical protein
MRARAAFVAAFLALAACGARERSVDAWIADLRSEDPAVAQAAAEGLGRLGRKDPAVVQRLVLELSQDRSEPDVSMLRLKADLAGLTAIEAENAAVEIARVLPNRLQAAGFPTRVVEAHAGGDYLVRLQRPPPDRDERAYLEAAIAVLERLGSLELLVVVSRPEASGEALPDWDGDTASYDAFVAEESRRWREAVAAGTRPVSSRPGWRAVPSGPADGDEQWLVVREPEPGRRFDEHVLTPAANAPAGRPASLMLQPSPDRQDAFEAWTKELVGRRVVLVVDGRAAAVVTITAPAREVLEVPMGPDPEASAERARAIVRGSIGGRLRWPVRGEIVPPAPAPDGPFSRALAAVGPAADDALARLEQGGGPAAPAARWAREEILRQRTRAATR